jgi:hypothetical protein
MLMNDDKLSSVTLMRRAGTTSRASMKGCSIQPKKR